MSDLNVGKVLNVNTNMGNIELKANGEKKSSSSIFSSYSSNNINKDLQQRSVEYKEPLSEVAKADRKDYIKKLKDEGIKFKENPDGSIEYVLEGIKMKDIWHGNKMTSQNLYPNKSVLIYTLDLETQEQKLSAENADKTLRQEMNVTSDFKMVNKKSYIKGKDGKFYLTEKFVGTNMEDASMYNGSDIAKLFGTGRFNINSEDETHRFFNAITTDNLKTSFYKDGTIIVEVADGTTIKYIKQNENDKGFVQIEKNGRITEKYDTKGNPIK